MKRIISILLPVCLIVGLLSALCACSEKLEGKFEVLPHDIPYLFKDNSPKTTEKPIADEAFSSDDYIETPPDIPDEKWNVEIFEHYGYCYTFDKNGNPVRDEDGEYVLKYEVDQASFEVYDENENILYKISYILPLRRDWENASFSTEEYTYGDNGKCTEKLCKTQYVSDGYISSAELTEYFYDGSYKEEYVYDILDGEKALKNRYEYTYSDDGNHLLSSTSYSTKSKSSHTTKYFYDESWHRIRTENYNDDKLSEYTEYNYDENGRTLESTDYDSDGQLRSRQEYINDENNKAMILSYDRNGVLYFVNEDTFLEDGRIRIAASFSTPGGIYPPEESREIIEWVYDKPIWVSGNKYVSITNYASDGEIRSRSEYSYIYIDNPVEYADNAVSQVLNSLKK